MSNGNGAVGGAPATVWTPGVDTDDPPAPSGDQPELSNRTLSNPTVAAAFADLAASAARPVVRPAEPEAPPPTLPTPRSRAASGAIVPLSPTDLGSLADLAHPSAPCFSPDGLHWYDGTRWTRVETDTPAPTPARRGGRRTALVVALVLVLAGLVAGLAFGIPALLDRQTGALDGEIEQALTSLHVAQLAHHDEAAMFSRDLTELDALAPAPLVPENASFEVQVLRATAMGYCAAGGPLGGEARLYVDESGEVSRSSCA